MAENKSGWQGKRLQHCPYRQDLDLFCSETCGKGAAIDCPIWLKESGLAAQALYEGKE